MEEDFRKKEADKKKKKVLAEVQILQQKFEDLKKKNSDIEEIARLSPADMTVDMDYVEMLN